MIVVVVAKLVLNRVLHFEPLAQSSLQNSLISSAIFVISFLLSSTISDYKESERIPAEFASNIDDMYHDARELHQAYPGFDLSKLRKSMIVILDSFRGGTRKNRIYIRKQITGLHKIFGDMETAGVPPNFITKLKHQESLLSRSLFRVNYIQRIEFIPSAGLLVWLIVVSIIVMLLLTDLGDLATELYVTGIISFILVYILLLIRVIREPFQAKGKTRDDVSLFLINEVRDYLKREETKAFKSASKKQH
jgi:hypothetical protein